MAAFRNHLRKVLARQKPIPLAGLCLADLSGLAIPIQTLHR
ncbi:hypothetical protein KUC_0437 [Vreelandella boliviensis LC1]|uniref:Uncharacterized protein n=1 Tax=Vreelandella boliviensis LC1 TaxID=1072583 RepID=A0A7U9C2P8_9GAMM|nr:hypothetical protein KUC_0437 [Halomonas boliviensis LC1]